MAEINRVAWMVIFLLGTAVFAWMEWHSSSNSAMVWFMLTSMWSAVCGIGYTVLHWFITNSTSRGVDNG